MEKLGINPSFLVTQIVNFTILAIVLSKLVYKPILEMLEKRRKKIEEGLKLTESLIKEKEELNTKTAQVLGEANKEAKAIIEKSREQGKKVEEGIIKEARTTALDIIEKGKKDIEIRRKEMETEIVQHTIQIAVSLTNKLIGDLLDSKKSEALLKKRLTQFLKLKN